LVLCTRRAFPERALRKKPVFIKLIYIKKKCYSLVEFFSETSAKTTLFSYKTPLFIVVYWGKRVRFLRVVILQGFVSFENFVLAWGFQKKEKRCPIWII